VVIGPASALLVDKTAFLSELATQQAADEAAKQAEEEAAAATAEPEGGAFGVLPTISE
jgi:hypothetical protein